MFLPLLILDWALVSTPRSEKAMLEPMYGDGADHYLQWVEHHVKSKAPWQVWRPGFLPAAYVPVYPRNVQ